MWKDFFYYTKKERIAIILLLVLIFISFLFLHLFSLSKQDREQAILQDSLFINQCDSFYKSLSKKTYDQQYGVKPKPDLFYFDPNQIDSIDFLRLGLPSFVARNIMRYRLKGGIIRNVNQFSKIYGLSHVDFERVKPFIRIDTSFFKKEFVPISKDSFPNHYLPKFDTVTLVELNSADTSTLMKIPGIGRGYASMILSYRNRLGGFHDIYQLKEIPYVTDSLIDQLQSWFTIDTCLIKPIDINKAGITRLRNHPYLNFYQAKVIYELRKQEGRLNKMDDLILLEEFTESDFKRLTPYLRFN